MYLGEFYVKDKCKIQQKCLIFRWYFRQSSITLTIQFGQYVQGEEEQRDDETFAREKLKQL